MVENKYNEQCYLYELADYIFDTYDQHYSQDKYQATEVIIDAGHGEGFCIGNIMKYAQRYGKKNGYDRKDLLKIIHYAIIALFVHDNKKEEKEDVEDDPELVSDGLVYVKGHGCTYSSIGYK